MAEKHEDLEQELFELGHRCVDEMGTNWSYGAFSRMLKAIEESWFTALQNERVRDAVNEIAAVAERDGANMQ